MFTVNSIYFYIFLLILLRSQSIPTTTSRTQSSIGSNSNHDSPHDNSVGVDNVPSRRRSSRSRQASVLHASLVDDKIAKKAAITIHDVDADDDDGDDSVVVTSNSGTTSKVPRKSTASARDESVTIDLNSLLKNKDTLMSTATNKTGRPTSGEIKHPPNETQPPKPGTPPRNNAGTTFNTGIATTTSTELSKEEKLRKFIATQQHQKQLQQQASPTGKTDPNKSSSGKLIPIVVLNDLRQICCQFTSQSQNKKLRLEIHPSRKGRVDLFGSFIYSDDVPTSQQYDDRYDFFDTNDKGEIIVTEPPPIFPDEFPNRIPTHTAAWWGIVEPSLGIGKYKNLNQSSVAPAIISTVNNTTKTMVNPVVNLNDKLKNEGTVEERVLHNRSHDTSTTKQLGKDYQSDNHSQSIGRNERSTTMPNVDSRQHQRERNHGNTTRMEYANRDPIASKTRITNESQSSRNHRQR
jgi:hypothetical protein